VQPNETLKLEIGVRPTIPVTGLILTADTHEPVKGARISYRCPTQRSLIISHHAETDERGRYHTRLIAGEVARQVIAGVSTPYEYPRLEPIQIPAHVEKYEAPEISIHPMHLVKGTLVDHSGAPVLGATVVLHTGSYRHVAGRAETQVDGSFQMRVRSWNLFRKSTSGTLKDRWYWAILDQPAINANPPHFTRLELVNDNPDNFVLRYPKD
jgi:hypothetical protein